MLREDGYGRKTAADHSAEASLMCASLRPSLPPLLLVLCVLFSVLSKKVRQWEVTVRKWNEWKHESQGTIAWTISRVQDTPNLLGTRDPFRGRQCSIVNGFRMIWVHYVYYTLYFCYNCIRFSWGVYDLDPLHVQFKVGRLHAPMRISCVLSLIWQEPRARAPAVIWATGPGCKHRGSWLTPLPLLPEVQPSSWENTDCIHGLGILI